MNHLLLTCNKHTGSYYYYTVKFLEDKLLDICLRHIQYVLILSIWLYHQAENKILPSS